MNGTHSWRFAPGDYHSTGNSVAGSWRADSIRPYNCGGKAADGSTTSRPLQGVCKTVSEQQRTGRVREPMYRYKPGASLSGGTAAAGGCYPPLQMAALKD